MTIEQLPISGHLNPIEITASVINKLQPKDILLAGVDAEGYLFLHTSEMSYEAALWILERAKIQLFRRFEANNVK